MKLSIIIPTLNEEKVLPSLLEDLSNQTIKDFEVIVSDGNSDDATKKVAEDFSIKFNKFIFVSSKSRGVSHQRNVGGAKASGEWLVFMDADDRLPKNYVEMLLNDVEKNIKVDVFTTWCDVDSSKPVDKWIAKFINIGFEIGKSAKYPMVMGSLIGVRKKVFEKVGGFSEEVSFREDSDFVQDCVKKGFFFDVYQKPKYVYSLRRTRRMGRMNFIRKAISLNFKRIFEIDINQNLEYPMGGIIETIKEEDILEMLDEKFENYIKRNNLLKKIKEVFNKFII